MPATTPGGMPYPLGTDPIADGDDAIKNLAFAITAPVIATYTVVGGWQGEVSSPRLTKVAGRWHLAVNMTNNPGGTYNQGALTIGSVPTAARTNIGIVRAVANCNGFGTINCTAVDINTGTGDVKFYVPATVTVGAFAVSYAFQASWDGQAT